MKVRPTQEVPTQRPLLHQVPDACRLLSVGRSTLYELIASGKLLSVTIGRRRLIAASEVERFAADLTKGAV